MVRLRVLALLLLVLLAPVGVQADITTNLIGHWRLDENGGTSLTDSSPTGATGTLVGSPTWIADNLGGFGLSLTATGQYVTIPDNNAYDVGTGNYTLALWVKGPFNAFVICKDLAAGAANGFYIYRTGTAQYGFWNGTATTTFAPSATDTGWHHLVAVRSGMAGNQVQLYSDNVAGAQASDGRTLTNAHPLRLFACADDTAGAVGTIGDVRIYSRALSASDVQELFLWTTPAPTTTRRRTVY